MSVTKSGTTSTISITDKDGAHSTTIEDGATGATGPQGPSGSDATVTRTNVINALGYTPSNSGLTQAEVESMIANSNQGDISIVQLPYKQTLTGGHVPPSSNYNGIFTWSVKTNSSGQWRGEDGEGGYGEYSTATNYLGNNTGANKTFISGLTLSSDQNGLGLALGIVDTGLFCKFKGANGSYLSTSSTNKNSASSWIMLCDRYGVLGQSGSIAFLNYYGEGSLSNWTNWSSATFPYGLSAGIFYMDGKQFYFAISMKYGSENIHAHKGYENYRTEWKGCAMLILLPYGNVDGNNDVIMVTYDANNTPVNFHMFGTSAGNR